MLRSVKRMRVGTGVCFNFAGEAVKGTVIEDRGPIGVNGRHLYVVRVVDDEGVRVELPADLLKRRNAASSAFAQTRQPGLTSLGSRGIARRQKPHQVP